MPDLVLVAAIDRARAIGRGNALPWRLPEDLKRFKALTLGKPVLMGRRTAESLGRALPGRRNLVLSRARQVPYPGMEPVGSLDEALAACVDVPELMVIGGGEVYALCLPEARRMHLTHVDTVVADADAFFPAWNVDQWRVLARDPRPADERHACAYEFIDYQRRD